MTFEDPTQLIRCIKSDCQRARAGGSPFCAEHLREQEAKSAGIVEPDVEARVARVKTEDDEHPGMVKVYDRETGEPSWVPAETVVKSGAPGIHRAFAAVGMPSAEEMDTILMDPDINGGYRETDQIPDSAKEILLAPDPTELEPHWDGRQWILRPKKQSVDLEYVRNLVKELVLALEIDICNIHNHG